MQAPSIDVTVYGVGLAKVLVEMDGKVTAEVDYGGNQRQVVYARWPSSDRQHGMVLACIDMRVENTRWNQLAWVSLES